MLEATMMLGGKRVPNEPGIPFEGGFYAGKYRLDNGRKFALIVASKVQGGESSSKLAWKTAQSLTGDTWDSIDGWANTQAMLADSGNHPAANFCANLTIGGYTDWYLPSRLELVILYRSFKPTTRSNTTAYGSNAYSIPPTGTYTQGDPTQTSVLDFQQGGPEAFLGTSLDAYWSSSQVDSTNARVCSFYVGANISNVKTRLWTVRAVRRVAI